MPKLCVIRVRGTVHIKHDIRQTLELLNLKRKNNCVIVEDKPEIKGMIEKVKNYVTWGEINDETAKLLVKAKGQVNVFKLNPPLKGFERKGIKIPFSIGGALGFRKDKINDLIKRMI